MVLKQQHTAVSLSRLSYIVRTEYGQKRASARAKKRNSRTDTTTTKAGVCTVRMEQMNWNSMGYVSQITWTWPSI